MWMLVMIKIEINGIYWLLQKKWLQNISRKHRFDICENNKDTLHFDIKYIYNKIIRVSQWTISQYVPFLVLSHKNKNNTTLIICRRCFACRTTIGNNLMFSILQLINSTLTGYLFEVRHASTYKTKQYEGAFLN